MKTRTLILGVLLLMNSISCATAPKSKPLSIPFHYTANTFITVPVQLEGGIEASFILDTGIGVNILSKSLCAKLNCRDEGKFTGKRMSGQAVELPMSRVSSLTLGTHTVSNPAVGQFDIDALMPGQKISGFLSLGFFRAQPFTLDYPAKVLRLETEASMAEIRKTGVHVPVTEDIQGPSYGIHMPLVLPNGERITVEVDTGSQILILHERYMQALGLDSQDPNLKRREGKDETGHTYIRYFAQAKGMAHIPGDDTIGTRDPNVMFQKIIYDGLAGHYFFEPYRVTYDLAAKELIFRK